MSSAGATLEEGDGSSHWGSEAVDLTDLSLPALKASFLVAHLPDNGAVCEIGSGDGKLLRTLARYKPRLSLFGCDVRPPQSDPAGIYSFAPIVNERLPFADASLEAVLVFDVLEHVPDPEATLGEAARVLRPGGRLVAFIPVEGEAISFYEAYRRVLGRDTYAVTKEHIQAFRHETLRNLLERRFVLHERRYAYHPLGQLMDASFFAAARLSFIRTFWWKENAFYNPPSRATSSRASSFMNRLLILANVAAYAESRALAKVRWGSAGLLVYGTKRP